jgi:hypothetical protein
VGWKRSAAVLGGMVVAQGCARPVAQVARPLAPLPPPPLVAAEAPAPLLRVPPPGVRPAIYQAALAAMDRHSSSLRYRDRIAIADFGLGSASARFHLIDLDKARAITLLVTHGIGSDPEHTGFLQRFSNEEGSEASCDGAFVAADYYVGQHGQSQRLIGLDPTNNRAYERAIVIHAAWYANASMLATHGKLGRSQGCFAVGEGDLNTVFTRLGSGRMLYAAKV